MGRIKSIVAASGLLAIAGVAAIALGILSLLAVDTVILNPVALLCVGGSLVLSGSAIIGKMATLLGG